MNVTLTYRENNENPKNRNPRSGGEDNARNFEKISSYCVGSASSPKEENDGNFTDLKLISLFRYLGKCW